VEFEIMSSRGEFAASRPLLAATTIAFFVDAALR
jgi:hypothetical protein